MQDMILIHYGATEYKPELFVPIKNEPWVKPVGGLWTSPVNSEYGWKDWCEAEEFADCKEEDSFCVKLKEGARVLIIDSLASTDSLPKITRKWGVYLDFETLTRSCDAIWLTTEGQWATRLTRPFNLYGWDCESVLIMNPDSVYEYHSASISPK